MRKVGAKMLAAQKNFFHLGFPARTNNSKKDYSQALQFSPAFSVYLSELFFLLSAISLFFFACLGERQCRRSCKQNNFGGNCENAA